MLAAEASSLSIPSIDQLRSELERLEYRIIDDVPERLLAVRARWFYLLVRSLLVVSVRELDVLSADEIREDERRLVEAASDLKESTLLSRLLGMRILLSIYLCRSVDREAQGECTNPSPMHVSYVFVPASIDETGTVFRLRHAPLVYWGLFAKYSYVLRRLLEPTAAPTREPVGALGVLLGLLLLGGMGALALRLLA